MQAAIDNAKRTYDINLTEEIRRLKNLIEIENNGLPLFWNITKKDKRKCRSAEEKKKRNKLSKEKISKKTNQKLICPMNYLNKLDFNKYRSEEETLPMSNFFIKHELDFHHRIARKVEELIEKYSLELRNYVFNHDDINWKDDKEEYFLLRADFDEMINDIRKIGLTKKYSGLMSWLINRAFCIGAGAKRNINNTKSEIDKNKSILMKTLYEVNKDAFISCFTEKVATY